MDSEHKLPFNPNDMLTPKEREVLCLVATGLSSKEIAVRLSISFHTVESHRKNLRHKLNAHNVAEMISKAYLITLI